MGVVIRGRSEEGSRARSEERERGTRKGGNGAPYVRGARSEKVRKWSDEGGHGAREDMERGISS